MASQSFEVAVMHHTSLCCPLVAISLNFFDCFLSQEDTTVMLPSLQRDPLLSRILAKLQLWLGSLDAERGRALAGSEIPGKPPPLSPVSPVDRHRPHRHCRAGVRLTRADNRRPVDALKSRTCLL